MGTSYPSDLPFRLKLLTVSTSLAGILCLTLGGLLHWAAFIVFAVVHGLVLSHAFEKEVVGEWSARTLMFLLICFEAWRVFQYRGEAVIPAVRDLILALAMIRLVMHKTPRQIYQIVGIAFSQCMLATILTISPWFLGGLTLMIILVPMTLSELDAYTFPSRTPRRFPGAMHWAVVFIGIVLSGAVLFYVLPRPASSIVRHTLATREQYSFREDVDLSRGPASADGSAIVMRVIWTSGRTPERFYLSGARLDGLNPDGFFPRETPGESPPVSRRFSDSLRIYTSSLRSTTVFFPFWFHSLSPRTYTFRGENVHWVSDLPPVYDVRVSRTPTPSAPGSTEVPPELGPVAEMGKRLAGQGRTALRVDRIVRSLKQGYTYTMDPGSVPPGRDGIEWFVFTSRKGSCEHFAAALAAMIRGCGIPARVVTGFLVTEYNASGDYFIIRVSDAHAWVEYWDETWHTVDATPSGRTVPFMRFHLIDELRFRWLRWVIQYSLDDQVRIARSIFATGPQVTRKLEHQWRYAAYFLCAAAAVWGAAVLFRIRMRSPYEKVRRELLKKDLRLAPHSSHEDHLSAVSSRYPCLEPVFREYLRMYLAWRFGGRDADMDAHTRRIISAIRAAPGRGQKTHSGRG
ncbi:MAG TPA: transglutaminase domain-containing protein, partial [Deltaproteobacteria bacterium]|nr:transglutaminase domain-containing protein [Deltaproteobacteria bacterium]